MLHYSAVDPGTLELLKRLMSLKELQDFALVGGTALALQIGHRISVDVDLFTPNDFNPFNLFESLDNQFVIVDKSEDVNTLNLIITLPDSPKNGIKVDLLKYSCPNLRPVKVIDEIRLLSIEDIIPMKLSAIAGRGSKKDFYDIYYLLQSYTLHQMLEFFVQKYANANAFHILKSLTYFEDAEMEPDTRTIEKSDWNLIKKTIVRQTNDYLKFQN